MKQLLVNFALDRSCSASAKAKCSINCSLDRSPTTTECKETSEKNNDNKNVNSNLLLTPINPLPAFEADESRDCKWLITLHLGSDTEP